uniref:Uncharacterized protein n=1 Tax=Siphoviridae sp. ctrvp54 TaxID=2825690 RepID=A0A8S5P784_9CAUD|nr:MAG TPA: hypothetical protein [Siphoviridae sp. ctrvp54]
MKTKPFRRCRIPAKGKAEASRNNKTAEFPPRL